MSAVALRVVFADDNFLVREGVAKLLAEVQKGDRSKVPQNGLIIIPGIVVNKGNVDQFKADLQAKLKS